MDSRAKQRLTGAVILVALFVLLVPELLKGPRATDAASGTPTDEGLHRYVIDLDGSTPAAPAASTAAPSAVALPPVSPPIEAQPRAVPGESAAPAPDDAPAPDSSVTEVVTPAAASKAPVVTPPAPHGETPRPAAAVPAEPGSFVVQLGSFGSKENADRLVRDMTAKGFAAFVAPITSGGRELYRVRVGPTRDRPAAEALAAQLRRIGQSGAIVPIS